ncbi:sugar porter family MFS transporter [Colletotrichum gloeosporioides Cg-14]|uniref:Sugar porter family MFS transporter n=1 Tax=Colletotrichum gloeosporioides (strain Cg-14) TaxID=1237896 RepID=T0KYY1_COLGC|nr:sugar porter family MFS transporter [Colletotrichum gloeosporioides Cg-14]
MEPKSEVAMVEHANTCSDDNHNHDTLAAAEDGGKLDATDEQKAIQATLSEHDLTIWEALRRYNKAALWSMLVSMSIIMRAYDIEITGNFYALPAFRDHLGEHVDGHGMEIPVQWQVAMSMGPIVGQVAGAWLAAVPMDSLGRKKTLAIYLVMTSALVFMQVFAPNRTVLAVSMYLAGIIWGGYHVLAPVYASEVLPLRLRGIFIAYVSLCYVMGQFIQTGITRAFVSWSSVWAYKIPYALQWVWPIFILAFLYWCPESPWWLIRQNRLEDAKKALDRLSSKQCHAHNHDVLAMMVKTDVYERELEVGATFRDCFKGPNLRRLEIASAVFIVQNFSGNPVGFAVYLFEQTGLSSENAFNMGIGLNGVGFVGVFCSMFPIIWFGRRRAWMYGLTYNIACLWVVAFMCLAPDYKTNQAYSWAQASILITMQLVYSLTIGPLAYVISSEVPSTRLRAKTLSLTATFNGMSYLVITVAGPYLLNPGSANAGAMIEFLWGGLSLFSFAWSFFRLPETGDRTFEEIDYLFEHRVPARKFRGYIIDETHMIPNMKNKESI